MAASTASLAAPEKQIRACLERAFNKIMRAEVILRRWELMAEKEHYESEFWTHQLYFVADLIERRRGADYDEMQNVVRVDTRNVQTGVKNALRFAVSGFRNVALASELLEEVVGTARFSDACNGIDRVIMAAGRQYLRDMRLYEPVDLYVCEVCESLYDDNHGVAFFFKDRKSVV